MSMKEKSLSNPMNNRGYLPQVFEGHGKDLRYNPLGEVCSTVAAAYGMGGGNIPLVVQETEDE